MNLAGWFNSGLKAGLIVLLLLVCLGSEDLQRGASRWGSLSQAQTEVRAVFEDTDVQWLIVSCILAYFVGFFSFAGLTKCGLSSRVKHWATLGIALSAFGVLSYALNYAQASTSTDALLLCFGILMAFGFRGWRTVETGRSRPFGIAGTVLGVTVIFLCIGVFSGSESFKEFRYRGQPRLVGFWANPNRFGVLMGLGMVLAVGQAILILVRIVESRAKAGSEARIPKLWRWFSSAYFALAGIIMGIGLVKSLSRGAWVATAFSLCLSGCELARRRLLLDCGLRLWLRRNGISVFGILVSALVVTGFHHQQALGPLARRVVSVGNANDFSWRNRVSSWVGAMQMMSDKPWFGFGWNQPVQVYDQLYRHSKVLEGRAIQMNDYFILGATLGIPALACFIAFVALSLHREYGARTQSVEHGGNFRTEEICRAGAILLLLGFWFDGGLFYLATGAMFWILLALAGVERKRGVLDACMPSNLF
jgi:O-antigen ligase